MAEVRVRVLLSRSQRLLRREHSDNVSGQAGSVGSQVTVQPYAIKLPGTKKDGLVDLFDPDA